MFRALATTALRRNVVSMMATKPMGFSIRAFSDAGDKLQGTVKWFDSRKGFGFLVPDDGSEDVFVHQTAIHAEGFRSLMDGEPVEFEVVEDDNGRKSAASVTGPDGSYVQGRPRSDNFDGGFGGSRDGGGFY